MTPGARISAAIEILDALAASDRPADQAIGGYFRDRRYIGAKDRGFIAELVYAVLRHRASLQWRLKQAGAPATAQMLALAALVLHRDTYLEQALRWCDGAGHAPAPLPLPLREALARLRDAPFPTEETPEGARYDVPEWLLPALKAALGEEELAEALDALNTPAPVDLRVNTRLATREQVMDALLAEGMEPEPTPYAPSGVRLAKRTPIFATEAFRNGWFEVQDEGSQLAAQLVDAHPGMKVIDFCAGAGGKTLAMADAMGNKGRLLAWDVSARRLEEIRPRLKRAKVDTVQTHALTSEHDPFVKRHKASADRVLCDVPCSGSGTWRRNPDQKWKLTPERLSALNVTQSAILESAARLVKPGGRLVYTTCSLLPEENERIVEAFLAAHPEFTPAAPPLRLLPHRHGTDGFFGAALERGPLPCHPRRSEAESGNLQG